MKQYAKCTSRDEVMLNSEKINPVVSLAIIKLRLSVGISQATTYNSMAFSNKEKAKITLFAKFKAYCKPK